MKTKFTKLIILMVLVFTTGIIMAQTYTFPVKGTQGFSMTHKTRDGARINYELGQFSLDQINYRGEEMSEISIQAISIPCDAGLPNLPGDSRLIAIPQGATAKLSVIHAETQTFKNVNIAPALRIQVENEEPDMNYVKDMKVYGKNAFFPENPFVIGESSIRGVNAVSVAITPFQYNPVTKELVVYTDVELSLTYEGGNGHFGDDRLRSPYWDPILSAELANYDQLPVIDYEARMQQWLRDGAEGAEYVIVIPNNDGFVEPAERLKNYRMQQGIITEVIKLQDMPATTTAMMKSWFHNAYNNWEIAPVAILLFADHNTNMGQGIPAEEIYHSSSYGNCITDNQYADVTGDKLPEMIFSRLIAADATEAAMMADKQIEYEFTNPNMDPNSYNVPITALGWQTERWFQLCSEVVGGYFRAHGKNPLRVNCIYQGTPGTQWSSADNTSQVVSYFGPNGTNYIPQTPNELGGWTGGTPEQIVAAINQGTMLVQHRDHGLETGWGEPAFRNTHVAQLTNVGKMPFVFSINCLTGQFDLTSGPCFAEAFIRHTYNGQNAGAVGLICPTDVSYSFVNDALVWGIYDQFQPDFMPTLPANTSNIPGYERSGNWLPAFGLVAGKYFLSETNWPYNSNSKEITYQMFTAHCDAFLRLYTEVPQTITASHQNVQLAGLNTFQITAPEGTTIALTKGEGGNLEVVAVAQATGSVQTITIDPQVPPTVLHLTITGQNYLRYDADIDVIPADGPYVIINNYQLGNNATQLNYGDEVTLDIQLKNVGNSVAPAGTMTLTTESEYVTVTNGNASFNAINSNNTLDLSQAFSFNISDEVPNKTPIEFLITITSGNDTYENHITMKAYAPVFEIGNVAIRELNGNGNDRLDPGETVKLKFPIHNKGNADAMFTDATITINNAFMELITEPTITIETIAAEEIYYANFEILVGAAPAGFAAEYSLNVASGVYSASRDFISKIGLNVEDFELQQLDPSLWTNDATHPWTFVTTEPYEGEYCLKSGQIGDNQETLLTLNYQVGEADSIAFYYKVSSENNYDKMYFYIDNTEIGVWSGNVAWTRAQYAVTTGTHTFKWKYKKDTSVSSGSDCCWIDFVILPRSISLACSAGLDIDACVDSDIQVNGYAANYTSLEWATAGDGTFSDATIMNPIYTPGTQDLANGSVVLTITAHKDAQTVSDDVTVTFFENVILSYDPEGLQYCGIQEPQGISVELLSGEPTSFVWTTQGSGEFGNPSDMITTYTPSAEDIAAGQVTLIATAISAGCGPVSIECPIVLNPMPNYTMGIIPPCVFTVGQGNDYDFTDFGTFEGFVDGQLIMQVDDDFYTIHEGEPFMLLTSQLEPGIHTFEFKSISNGICESELEGSFTIEVIEAPALTVAQESYEICEGETVSFELTATGGNTDQPYTISGENMEPITFTGSSYTMELTPAETTTIHLTQIVSEAIDCSQACTSELNITLTVTVNPIADVPEISGATELDVRLTPTSTYTTANNVFVTYTLEPEEAGSIVAANDGKTVDITWSETFKGEVTLTATPNSECNNGESTKTIMVKNTTGVDEIANNTKLYPNPTNEKVNIEANGMTYVAIFNSLGQLMYSADVDTDKVVVDMKQFPAGMYLVRIVTHEGMCIKHLNVTR